MIVHKRDRSWIYDATENLCASARHMYLSWLTTIANGKVSMLLLCLIEFCYLQLKKQLLLVCILRDIIVAEVRNKQKQKIVIWDRSSMLKKHGRYELGYSPFTVRKSTREGLLVCLVILNHLKGEVIYFQVILLVVKLDLWTSLFISLSTLPLCHVPSQIGIYFMLLKTDVRTYFSTFQLLISPINKLPRPKM